MTFVTSVDFDDRGIEDRAIPLTDDQTNVVIALTGASSALAGLVLVFLGVLVASYQSLVGVASDKALRKFKQAALWALVVFGVSLVSVVIDASWLIADGGQLLYVAAVVLFFVQLAALAGVASYSTIAVLLRG